MQTRTYNVYKFYELPKEAQAKAISQYRDINVDNGFWENPDSVNDLKKELFALGYSGEKEIDHVKILFSGFGSQGDGACFEANIDILKYLKAHKIARKYPAILKEAKEYAISAKLKHSGMYYHSKMTSVEWDAAAIGNEKLDQEIDALDALISKEREAFGNAIYKALSDEFDHLTSDEAVIDTLNAGEYDFTIEGQID